VSTTSPVLLDANILAEASVSDLILRLSNGPRLFAPSWTEEIWIETRRTMLLKLRWPDHIVDSRITAAKSTFPEAMVSGYEHWLPLCTNDPKDKHLLAAAIHAGIPRIVTVNTKHFSKVDLGKWDVEAVHPDAMLAEAFQQQPSAIVQTVNEMAYIRNKSVSEMLSRLSAPLPVFAKQVGFATACEFSEYDSTKYRTK